MDPAPAGGRAASIQRDTGMLHWSTPNVAQLLDTRRWSYDTRITQVSHGEYRRFTTVQDAHASIHCKYPEQWLRHVQVCREESTRRDGRYNPVIQYVLPSIYINVHAHVYTYRSTSLVVLQCAYTHVRLSTDEPRVSSSNLITCTRVWRTSSTAVAFIKRTSPLHHEPH